MSNLSKALRQSGISIALATATAAIQHTTWESAAKAFTTFFLIMFCAFLIFIAADQEEQPK